MRAQEAFRLLIFNYIACLSIGLHWITTKILCTKILCSPCTKTATHFATVLYTKHLHRLFALAVNWKKIHPKNKFLRMCVYLFSIWARKKFLFGIYQPNELSKKKTLNERTKRKKEKKKSNSLSTTNFWRNSINRPNSNSKLYKFLIESYLLIFPLPLEWSEDERNEIQTNRRRMRKRWYCRNIQYTTLSELRCQRQCYVTWKLICRK